MTKNLCLRLGTRAALVRMRQAVLAAAMITAMGTPVAAEVLDTIYRGTMVCDKLPFTSDQMRQAIEVTIVGGVARYTHVVRLRNVVAEAEAEQGTGTINGQKIDLHGTWNGASRQYEAKYSGSFVRRSARLKGTQTWTDGGKTVTRTCAGVIKRPLKPFLPRDKKQAAAWGERKNWPRGSGGWWHGASSYARMGPPFSFS
jgi:hypothetical protein